MGLEEHNVKGNVNSEYYIDHIINGRVEQFKDWFADGSGIFQHDNAPSHRSKQTQVYLQAKQINVMTWPAQLSKLNPTDNFLAIMKHRLSKHRI